MDTRAETPRSFRPLWRRANDGASIGLVIVIGLLLMGLVSHTPVSLLLLASLVGGALVGFPLWLRHR